MSDSDNNTEFNVDEPENESIDSGNKDNSNEETLDEYADLSMLEMSSNDPESRKIAMLEDLDNPVALLERVYQIWWHWADFHLHIISPSIDYIYPPVIIEPEVLPNSHEHQFVYPIHDFGSRLSTSKGAEMYSAGMSMCKLYYTIEKMVSLLIERLQSGGIDTETEVQVAFGGHQLAQRKAFESIINLSYNVVVTNFDPGAWGENYLKYVQKAAARGYGYPSGSPRAPYDELHKPSTSRMKN